MFTQGEFVVLRIGGKETPTVVDRKRSVVVARMGTKVLNEQEQVDNARLFAAAPELVQAARVVLRSLLVGEEPGDEDTIRLQEALKKASPEIGEMEVA